MSELHFQIKYRLHAAGVLEDADGKWTMTTKQVEIFVEGILEDAWSSVQNCDPSPKMITHEPYRTIGEAVCDTYALEESND